MKFRLAGIIINAITVVARSDRLSSLWWLMAGGEEQKVGLKLGTRWGNMNESILLFNKKKSTLGSEEELEKFFYWIEKKLSAWVEGVELAGIENTLKAFLSFFLLMLFNVSEHNFPPLQKISNSNDDDEIWKFFRKREGKLFHERN